MPAARRLACLTATLVASLVSACGPQRVAGPAAPAQDVVVLLVDADTGAVGRAVVSNAAGSTTLETERAATSIAPGQPPGAASNLSEADVTRLFGDALSALPPAPRHFTLYFR